MDMSQLICGGCRTLLMYTRGATSVRCSCCHTMRNTSIPVPASRPHGTPSSGTTTAPSTTQTVIVQNPMSVDGSGKTVIFRKGKFSSGCKTT